MLDELSRQKTMQLATERDGQPWICTVYFVVSGGNFYWLSFPERRHSEELAENPHAAVAIAIKPNLPVIGLQCAGMVTTVDELSEIKTVLARYVEKYGQGEKFVELYKAGKNHHVLYRLTPAEVVVFDEMSHLENPRQAYLRLDDIDA